MSQMKTCACVGSSGPRSPSGKGKSWHASREFRFGPLLTVLAVFTVSTLDLRSYISHPTILQQNTLCTSTIPPHHLTRVHLGLLPAFHSHRRLQVVVRLFYGSGSASGTTLNIFETPSVNGLNRSRGPDAFTNTRTSTFVPPSSTPATPSGVGQAEPMSGRTGRASPSYGDYDPSSGRQQQRASSSNAGSRSGFTSHRSRPRKYGDQEDTSRRSSSAGGFIPPRWAPPTYDSYTQSGMMGYGGAAPSSYASYASYGTYSAYGNGMSAYGYANTYGNGSGYGYDSTRGYHSTASNFAYNDPNNNTSSGSGYSSYRLASSSSSTSQPTFPHQYSAYASNFDQDPASSQPASMHPPQSGQPKLNPLEAMLQRAREQTRRSRSSSPTPPGTTSSSRTSTKPSSKASSPPPRLTEPSEEYLRTTLQPSTRISDGDPEEGSRKLIVLDLNGSLVLRSAHVTASARKAAASKFHVFFLYSSPYISMFLLLLCPPIYWSSILILPASRFQVPTPTPNPQAIQPTVHTPAPHLPSERSIRVRISRLSWSIYCMKRRRSGWTLWFGVVHRYVFFPRRLCPSVPFSFLYADIPVLT